MPDPAENYLRDVVPSLLERARQAKAGARGDPFETGRVQAYYEVLSTLVNQLDAFGIDRAKAGIDERLDLERDLLS